MAEKYPQTDAIESNKLPAKERRTQNAFTRARNERYLTYPLLRAGYGNSGATMQQPSRFLEEIPDELVDAWNLGAFA